MIEAVTSANTYSFYSIMSTGKPFIIEVREVSCVCESYLFGNGSECQNKAYVSQWKPINLKTGKVLLDDVFQNTHWNSNCSNSDVSTPSEESNPADTLVDEIDMAANIEFNVEDPMPSGSTGSNVSNAEVDRILAEIENLDTFTVLQEYSDNIDENDFPGLILPINSIKRTAQIDRVAQFSMPNDAPNNLIPVHTVGDGNCLPRAVSTSLFGNESEH